MKKLLIVSTFALLSFKAEATPYATLNQAHRDAYRINTELQSLADTLPAGEQKTWVGNWAAAIRTVAGNIETKMGQFAGAPRGGMQPGDVVGVGYVIRNGQRLPMDAAGRVG